MHLFGVSICNKHSSHTINPINISHMKMHKIPIRLNCFSCQCKYLRHRKVIRSTRSDLLDGCVSLCMSDRDTEQLPGIHVKDDHHEEDQEP